MTKTTIDRTSDYARKIINGEILASKKNIQSAERHIKDMNLKVFKYHFDVEKANKVINFIEKLPVPKTMEQMELKQFQCYIIGSLFKAVFGGILSFIQFIMPAIQAIFRVGWAVVK